MKRTLMAIATATLLMASAHGQPGGRGPGMMDGYGPGSGWGGGMMDGYGHGYGRDPGWHGMMGPEMGFGHDYWSLKLSDEQRDKILAVERTASSKRWELMGKMREQGLRMRENYATGKLDDDAARKNYQAMSEVHRAMFEIALQARKDVQAVLTPEQREQMGRRR